MKDSLLTWLIFIMVMGMFCGNCDDSAHSVAAPTVVVPQLSAPSLASYPSTDRGMFLGFTTDNGEGAVAIVYVNDAGELTQRYFQICYEGHTCNSSSIIRDEVSVRAAFTPGDHIAITRTADTVYAITKEE